MNTKVEIKSDGTVVMSYEYYEMLLEDSRFLNALRAAGVDNWDGYSEAFEFLDEEKTTKTKKKAVKNENY